MKVYELLHSPEQWTQEKPVDYKPESSCKLWPVNRLDLTPQNADPNLCCFCLLGAVEFCYPNTEVTGILLKICGKLLSSAELDDLDGDSVEYPVTEWNDDPERTFEEVRQLAIDLDI